MLEFKDILGHEQIKEHFQNAAATGESFPRLYSKRRRRNGKKDPCKCLCHDSSL